MLKILKTIANDLKNGENVENYLIILLAIVILVLDVFNLAAIEWVLDVTLAILALLAFGRINDRRGFKQLNNQILSISRSQLIQDFPEDVLRNDMRDCEELWLVGITLARTVNTYYSLFEEKLKQGHHIKVILAQPDSTVSELAAQRDRRPKTKAAYDNNIINSLNDLCGLADITNGDLQIRTIKTLLSFGYYAMSPDQAKGKMYLEHYGFKIKDDIPKMILFPHDGYLYDTFFAQLNMLWKHSIIWDCTR